MRGNVSRAEQTARRALVLQSIIAGQTYAQLRAQFGVSDATLSRDVRALGEQLSTWAKEQQNRALATAIAAYQRVVDQAWADHDQDAENERRWLAGEFAEQTQVPDAVDGARTEKRTQQQFRSQKADYLRVIVAATEKLCKLAGLEAAVKLDVHQSMSGQVDVHHSFEPERPERVWSILEQAGIIALGPGAPGSADDTTAQ